MFISVGLAATGIRLAIMAYILARKFLLWRRRAKDQGLYSIFFSYFYPRKRSRGWSLGTGEFYHWTFWLNLQIYCALLLARKGKKEVVTTTKISMSKALILFLSLSFSGSGDDGNMVAENIRSDWVLESLELAICVKIRIRFKEFEAGKGFLFNRPATELSWFTIASMCLIKLRKMQSADITFVL